MSRRVQSGSRRLLDHLSLALVGLAALAMVWLGGYSSVSLVCALCALIAGIALWSASAQAGPNARAALGTLLSAQARLGEILIPVWRGQIGISCHQMSRAAETMAHRMAAVTHRLSAPLPEGEPAAQWQDERRFVLSELGEATLQLQFQDRVEQILGHVSHSIDLTAARMRESRLQFERGGWPAGVDVDALISELESSYTTPDEHAVHRDRHGHPPGPAHHHEEITFF